MADTSKIGVDMMDFRDPRLHHLKREYSRAQMMPHKITFANDQAAFQAALDEIIKFNNFINEYNYILEIV